MPKKIKKPTDEITQFFDHHNEVLKLKTNMQFVGIAAIEAFFSWTEHVFIHIALLNRKIKTGYEVEKLAGANWAEKFKAALDISDASTKRYYDELVLIREQVRNFMAHGAFGKEGEAFHFHSNVGAVPLAIKNNSGGNGYRLRNETAFDEERTLNLIQDFREYLDNGPCKIAKLYYQNYSFPIIMQFVNDGTYEQAMRSEQNMKQLVDDLSARFDRAANMDW